MLVADAFEKIRVNPGNFADGRKTFEEINYDDPAEFEAEKEHIREVRLYTADYGLITALLITQTAPAECAGPKLQRRVVCCPAHLRISLRLLVGH